VRNQTRIFAVVLQIPILVHQLAKGEVAWAALLFAAMIGMGVIVHLSPDDWRAA
jgi:hypothetical protein